MTKQEVLMAPHWAPYHTSLAIKLELIVTHTLNHVLKLELTVTHTLNHVLKLLVIRLDVSFSNFQKTYYHQIHLYSLLS